jgi:hypothetical protein
MDTVKKYVELSSKKHQLHFLVKIDNEDLTMTQSWVVRFLENIAKENTHVSFEIKRMLGSGKIQAINSHVTGDFDAIACIADDIHPKMSAWDDYIYQKFDENYDQCLNFNCDPRTQDFTKLIIFPIIGKKLYDRFGYIYHPSYKSEWCDNEQTEVYESLGKLKHINDKNAFFHDWWGNQDHLMQKNMQIGLADKQVFLDRKEKEFK